MNLTWIDWIVVGLLMLLVGVIGFVTRKLTQSVSDFLAANRCAGRYLISVSEGMASLGAISIVAAFEQYYQAGFPAQWWTWMVAPLGIILSLSGWVTYRFRETKALTMAQFFEMRYSRKFRIFSGILAWVSGILNYGVFPGVTARFIICFCGFPAAVQLGGIAVPTLAVVMFIMLSLALFLTFCGGQIAVMITDFIQGQIVFTVFAVIIFILLFSFRWDTILTTLKTAPEGASMLNPFAQDISKIRDFNLIFFLIMAFGRIYSCKAWLGAQGYNSAAKSAHEARMASVVGEWRGQILLLAVMLMPICAWVLMHSPEYSATAAAVNSSLSKFANPQLQEQMLVPTALSHMLPVGIMGMFTVVILASALSTDDTYLHSWGSIFIQDVIMPFRKKPFSLKTHMLLLKTSILGVAVFSFFFSLYFPLKDYIMMYFQLTGAIFLGGAGSVIIGGLYWKRGTTAGAWAGMIIGCVLAVGGVVVKTYWTSFPFLVQLYETCPMNGMHLTFIAGVAAIVSYVIISLLTCRKPFDLDKMLHRSNSAEAVAGKRRRSFKEIIGISKEFTKFDKFIYYATIGWSLFWISAFLMGTAWGLTHKTTDDGWGQWWFFMIMVVLVVSIITIIWFIWGGIRDLIDLFKTLTTIKRNDSDDGWVEKDGPEKVVEVVDDEMRFPHDEIKYDAGAEPERNGKM